MSSRQEQLFVSQYEHLSKVLEVNASIAARLSEHFSRDNHRLPVRKPSQASLGAAFFMLGLDYYTHKLQQSLLPTARSIGRDTSGIEIAINNPASWIVTMKGGGISGSLDSEVSLKSFIEEPTGSRQGSLASPDKLAVYTNFFSDVLTIVPIMSKYKDTRIAVIQGEKVYQIAYGASTFVNLQAMGLALISVHPGGVNDELFRDIPDVEIRNAAVREGKGFLQRMQLFRVLLRNSLLNQKGANILTDELTKALGKTDDNTRLGTLDVIVGLQGEETIRGMQRRFQELAKNEVNADFNTALSEGIDEYLQRHLHLE